MGLKVDVQAVPRSLQAKLRAGNVNLDDPATTLALLKLNSVVGVSGFFDPAPGGNGRIKSMGIQCALCHSTVDDSFAPGIGRRLDGWPNRDLNVGAIINLAPDVSPFTTGATLMPAAFGLAGVNLHTSKARVCLANTLRVWPRHARGDEPRSPTGMAHVRAITKTTVPFRP